MMFFLFEIVSSVTIFTVMRFAMRLKSRRFVTGIILLVVFLVQVLELAFITCYK